MSEDRLTRIESNVERLVEAVTITNQSVQSLRSEVAETSQSVRSLRSEIAQGFQESRNYADSSFGAIVQVMDERDTEVRAEQAKTETLLQTLIDDGKADRAEAQRQRTENEREHQAFREQFQQLLGQLVARFNEIWERLNAS